MAQAFLKGIVSLSRNHDQRIQLCAVTIITTLAATQTCATAILDAGTCVCLCVYVYIHTYIHTYIHIYIYIYIYILAATQTCATGILDAGTCVCLCVYIYVYIYIYTHTHTHTYMHTCCYADICDWYFGCKYSCVCVFE